MKPRSGLAPPPGTTTTPPAVCWMEPGKVQGCAMEASSSTGGQAEASGWGEADRRPLQAYAAATERRMKAAVLRTAGAYTACFDLLGPANHRPQPPEGRLVQL